MENNETILNFYGIAVSVSGHIDIVNKIASDFAYFKSENNNQHPNLHISIFLKVPPYENIPKISASMYKPDCICYDKDDFRYVDYFGKALTVYDIKKNKAEIFSLSADLLYEISYLFLHSRAGEMLDLKGLHRIHGCAFSFEDNIYICMMAQGGGKSTLLADLLKNEKVKLISDDTPLVNSKGEIYPFPIRIGLHTDCQTDYIDDKFISFFKRRKFGEKKLISYEYFKDRIEKRLLPVTILYGKRIFNGSGSIIVKPKFSAFKELMKNCVIGYGLPQVLEYFLISGFKDFFKKAYLSALRFQSCINLVFKSKKVYCFYIGNEKTLNAELFFDKFQR